MGAGGCVGGCSGHSSQLVCCQRLQDGSAILRRCLCLTCCRGPLARDGTSGNRGCKAPGPCRHALSSVWVGSCKKEASVAKAFVGTSQQALEACPQTHQPAPSSVCSWCRSRAAGSPPATFWPEAYMSSFNSSASTCAGKGFRQLAALSFGVSACWRAGPLSRRARGEWCSGGRCSDLA